jgi:hypothetical protein
MFFEVEEGRSHGCSVLVRGREEIVSMCVVSGPIFLFLIHFKI